jgi:5'-methylthioadenosine phosphorylase
MWERLTMPESKIGVIGGSGLYEIEGMTDVDEVKVKTPFGEPSDSIVVGDLDGKTIAFLPRHGRGHRFTPSEVPVRANIYALKSLGVEWIISVNAVGSLREDVHPLDIVVPDQLIDRTKSRVNSFFDGMGLVAHLPFAEPFCPVLSDILHRAARDAGASVHKGGAYVVMEGPFFSTKAESNLYRSWGASIIGMTALPEAKLAREAEMCYATIACITDYDTWHETEESVNIEMAVANLQKNVDTAKRIIGMAAERIPQSRGCACASALGSNILTDPQKIPARTKQDLALLIGKYVK